jgi:hypothetical protein
LRITGAVWLGRVCAGSVIAGVGLVDGGVIAGVGLVDGGVIAGVGLDAG